MQNVNLFIVDELHLIGGDNGVRTCLWVELVAISMLLYMLYLKSCLACTGDYFLSYAIYLLTNREEDSSGCPQLFSG